MVTTAGEGSSYQGGAGGKFRKKPFKKPQSTPYERHPTALRNPSWVAKLIVDPATKLVAAGANLFFSSVYRKRLGAPPPPPPPQGANQESRERFLETVKPHPFGDQGQTSNDNGKQVLPGDLGLNMMVNSKQTKSTENGGLSELEIMLKQKTFTRSEIDRLTELLHSRTVELSNGTEENSTKLRPQETGSALRGSDNFARNSLHETRNGSHLNEHRYDGHVSTAVVGSKDFEEDLKTPVELAKDFMSNSSSKMPPSVLSLRSQAMREGPGALCNSPFAQRSPAMSLIQKPASHAGVFENGYATPKSRGRSAIYNMARTPYSRLPTASITDNHYIYDGSGGPSASSPNGFARELVARSVSKDMALKRRSSVLDDEIGSVGPIRRLRQKTNLSTPSNMVKTRPFSSSETEIVPNGCLDPSSSSKALQKSEDNERMPGTRHTPVPPQSKEAARKILQQLQMVSPKEKQLEGRASGLSEKLPSKLTPDMLNKQALRSLQDADSPNILHDAGYSLNYKQKTPLLDTCETSSQRQDKKVAKNGPKSVNVFCAGKSNGIISSEDTVPASSVSDSAKKQNTTLSSPKKWGFQMSAHEDFFELDDEIPSSEAAVSTKLAEEKKTLETPGPSSILIPVIEDKITTGSEFKAPAVPSEFGKLTNLETSDVTKVVERNSGFTFSPAVSSSFLPVVSVSQATNFAKDVPDQEPNVPSHSSSSAVKTDDINAPFSFSSPPFGGGSVEQSTTPPAEVKQETTASLTTNASGTTRTVPKPAEFDNDGFRNKQKPGDAVGKLDNSSSLPQPTSNLFSVSSNPSFSNSKDHSLKSTAPSIPSWPTPTNSTSNLNPFTVFGFSTSSSSVPSVETSTSISAPPSSILAPAYKFGSTSNGTPSTTTITTPAATPFQFGSTSINTSSSTTSLMPSLNTTTDFKSGSLSMAPSTYSTVSTTSIASDVKAKTEKEPDLGKLPGNPFGATSFPSASSGSSIFGFSAGSTSSSAASPSQGSMLGTSNVPAVSTQSLPVLGSSASSSILGISGSTTFATGSALFPSNPSSLAFGNTTSSSSIFGNNNISSSYPLTSSASSNSMFGLATTSNIGSSSSFGQATSAPSSTGFVFGEKPSQTPIFGSSTSASSTSSIFPFNSAPQSQPAFGNSPVPAFSSLPGGNNGDQMTMAEDSMAEDQVQAGPTPTPPPPFPIIFGGQQVQNTSPNPVPVFGQPQVQNSSPNPFMFGQTPSSATGAAPFQFGGQQNQPIAQNPNPFQPSGSSLDFGGGGGGSSFSLGSGGDDKSGRRMIRVKHKGRRK